MLRSGLGSNELLAAEANVILKIIQWILRLLAWPWAARGSLERWPAAPQMTAGDTRRQIGRDANANKTAEDWTLYGLHGQGKKEAGTPGLRLSS